jgi:hypothetical protein
MMSERELVAYHEAGHAVVAHALGLPVESVTIKPSPEDDTLGSSAISAGAARREAERMAYDYSAVWRSLVLTVAGPVAQALEASRKPFAGPSPRIDWNDAQFGMDLMDAVDSCLSLGYPGEDGTVDTTAVLYEAEAAACVLLRSRWGEVEDLAEHLLKAKTLSGDEVRAILNEPRE